MNSILDFEILQQLLVVVLCGQAGIQEVAIHMAPFLQTSVVEEFQLIGDDERHDAVCKTLLEHHQPAHTTVPVLERVDGLKFLMEVDDVLQRLLLLGIVGCEEGLHTGVNFLRRAGGFASYLIGEFLVVAHVEPRLPAVRRAGLEDTMQLLYKGFREFFFRPVDDEIDATEVVGGFHDVVHVDALVRDADGVGFKDIACLLMGQATALDMVGVVGKVNLGPVIDAATDLSLLLLTESLQQRRCFYLSLLGKMCVLRDVPSLS